MDELLKEFWAAWKRWQEYVDLEGGDDAAHYSKQRQRTTNSQETETERMLWKVRQIATRIRLFELQVKRAPCPAVIPDIPGQTYITDPKPVGTIKPRRRVKASA